MKKIKRIFVGMCMMFMLFSADVVAQTYVDGATAITSLNQEKPVLDVEYDALDQASPSFDADAADIKRKFLAVEQIIRSLEASSGPEEVEGFLREVVFDMSVQFTKVDEEMYENDDFGSTEIVNLHSYLKGILTN